MIERIIKKNCGGYFVLIDVQEKSNTVGLKRVLSEGEEKEKEKVERDGKRPKIDGVELEAQLELKITAKAGSRLKLEKVCLANYGCPVVSLLQDACKMRNRICC